MEQDGPSDNLMINTNSAAVESIDLYRIALYYYYIPIRNVEKQMDFHQSECQRLRLQGRIRVASEGINGVLSGRAVDLEVYRIRLEQELGTLLTGQAASIDDFDMKLCPLRRDLTVDQQCFTSLSVKRANQVVSLVDAVKDSQKITPGSTEDPSTRLSSRRRRKIKSADQNIVDVNQKARILFQESLEEIAKQERKTAQHLKPTDWHDKLLQLANDGQAGDVVLLDCRNIYESNIGHFRVPNATTILPNTRQFSDLPQVLMDQADRLSKCNHIFSFCTGGVRCERATLLLDKVLEERGKANGTGNENKPKLYQLQGGIQRYLDSNKAAIPGSSLFHGKNFVFDPRRTDPQNDGQIIGRCLVCKAPHDDYDNGHAPVEHAEVRCFQCRILLLVCSDCRLNVAHKGDTDNRPRLYCGVESCLGQPPVTEIKS